MKNAALLFCFSLIVISCAAQQPPDCQVKKITVYSSILLRGGNPAYKPSGDTIVYQKNLLNWTNLVLSTQLFRSDTGMNVANCISCDTALLPAAIRHDKHKGNAEYHPNGNFILFTSENENGAHQSWNLPGAGVDNDIFITNSTATQFWRLTNIPAGNGILHPAFSADGTKLFWAEMYYSTLFPPQGQEYGLWNLKMADFTINMGTPQLSNIVTFAPRDSVWYESHAFSPDNQFIAFTSHEEDSSAIFGDITIMDTADIGTGNFINLTNTPYIHDEHAHWSPDGNKMSWMSGTYVGGLETYKSELYLMDNNGANQVQLTHFTDAAYPEYIQDTTVTADHYWSPDGRRIFGFVHFINGLGWQSELYQLEFMGPCGLNPVSAGETMDNATNSLRVYPNPITVTSAANKLHIDFTARPETDIRIDIINVIGQTMPGGLLSKQKETVIDMAGFAPGIYFVKVTTNNQAVYQQKIIVLQ